MKAVRFAVTMKWLGLNIMRVSKWKIAQNRGNAASVTHVNGNIARILAYVSRIERKMVRFFGYIPTHQKMAEVR